MTDKELAGETPMIELARSVPADFRGEWEIQWWDDGTPSGHAMAPVGKYLHDMADEIERLTAENEKLRAALQEIASQCRECEMDEEDLERADFEQGYDMCVLTAREALETDNE